MFLVTGGAGFLGQFLVEDLVARGERVRSLDVLPHAFASLGDQVEMVQADITDPVAVSKAVDGCEVVYHNAALVPITRSGSRFWQVNVDGTRNVLEACLKHGTRKVVHISSSAVYGRPKTNPVGEETPLNPFGEYGKSKAEAERVCEAFQQRGLDISIIRPRPILGPRRLGILEILFERVAQGRSFFILGAGSNRFQLVSVHDLLSAAYLAATKPCRNEDFNVGAKQFTTLRDDLESLVAHAKTGSRIVSMPESPVRWSLRMLDWCRLSPFVSWHYRTASSDFWYPTEKLERVLGWSAHYSNVDTLREAYDWYVAHQYDDRSSSSPHRRGVKGRLLGVLLRVL